MSDSPRSVPETTVSHFSPFQEKLTELMREHDVTGVMVYVLPNSSDKPTYHTLGRGHFYDNAKLISLFVRDVKERMMHDLDGLM